MDVEAVIEEKQLPPGGRASFNLEIKGDDLGILIGRRGQTLSSLQYLLYLMLGHRLKEHVPLGLDVEGYLDRREESLKGLAQRMAERVVTTGQIAVMEPMTPRAPHSSSGVTRVQRGADAEHRRGGLSQGDHRPKQVVNRSIQTVESLKIYRKSEDGEE
jgi:predicted RNA-binding protein YlqC (UPF0109 family)